MPFRLLCTLHLVRHGETTANRKGIIQGHQDFDLSPDGVHQAAATAIRFRGETYWQAHSSDLTRASRTAEIILQEHPDVSLSRTPLLREFALGAQEGLPLGTTWQRALHIKAHLAGVSVDDYEDSFRESPADVRRRSQHFLKNLIADAMRAEAAEGPADAATGNGRTALIVSHGGLLNVMMLTEMDLEDAGIMSNCAVAVVDAYQEVGRPGVVRYVPRVLNDVSHFQAFELPPAGYHVRHFERH